MDESVIDDFRKKYDITVTGQNVPRPLLQFDQCTFPDYMMDKIRQQGFELPTPIQSQGWPIVMSGQNVVGIAQTGSGKTLSYIIPAIVHINNQEPLSAGEGPIALVLAPTRELAQQIQKVNFTFFPIAWKIVTFNYYCLYYELGLVRVRKSVTSSKHLSFRWSI